MMATPTRTPPQTSTALCPPSIRTRYVLGAMSLSESLLYPPVFAVLAHRFLLCLWAYRMG